MAALTRLLLLSKPLPQILHQSLNSSFPPTHPPTLSQFLRSLHSLLSPQLNLPRRPTSPPTHRSRANYSSAPDYEASVAPALNIDDRVPATVITGFLGSGKVHPPDHPANPGPNKSTRLVLQEHNQWHRQRHLQANAMGIGSGKISSLPRSFSANSSRSNDGLRELIKAASASSSSGHRVEMDLYLQHQMRRRSAAVVPRSCSVGMGRIDEEGPREFFGEEEPVYPRSMSYAVTKTSVVFR